MRRGAATCRIRRSPEGHAFVSPPTKANAGDFIGEHAGTRLLAFDQVAPEIVAGLDAGKF
jgi:hypothetical protein